MVRNCLPRSLYACTRTQKHNKLHIHLVLLQTALDQFQMSGLEAGESAVCPFACIRFLFVLVSAFDDGGTNFGLSLSLAQLFHSVVHIEASFLVEQAHFLQDTADVAFGFVVSGEIEFLVFVDQIFWDAQRFHAVWTVGLDILLCLDFEIGLGQGLDSGRTNMKSV